MDELQLLEEILINLITLESERWKKKNVLLLLLKWTFMNWRLWNSIGTLFFMFQTWMCIEFIKPCEKCCHVHIWKCSGFAILLCPWLLKSGSGPRRCFFIIKRGYFSNDVLLNCTVSLAKVALLKLLIISLVAKQAPKCVLWALRTPRGDLAPVLFLFLPPYPHLLLLLLLPVIQMSLLRCVFCVLKLCVCVQAALNLPNYREC